ncbi:hypothetical protein LT013_17245 [Vibrio cholerae]|nr:hypothetical protein [Vibrio cholerae]
MVAVLCGKLVVALAAP